MPHVVVKGPIRPETIARALRPVMERDEAGHILKTQGFYLATTGDSILVKALAIEGGTKQEFVAVIQARDDGVVVRLDPIMDPEKTVGVKRLLALLAKQIHRSVPGSAFGETNLGDLLA